jgi:hypothetical protein
VDSAAGRQILIETRAVAQSLAIHKHDDMLPQIALIIENISAQALIRAECIFQGGSQRQSIGVDFRNFSEAPQLLSKYDFFHAGIGTLDCL